MDDDGFAEAPTEFTGSDRGTHRRIGCWMVVVINVVLWTIVAAMLKSCLS